MVPALPAPYPAATQVSENSSSSGTQVSERRSSPPKAPEPSPLRFEFGRRFSSELYFDFIERITPVGNVDARTRKATRRFVHTADSNSSMLIFLKDYAHHERRGKMVFMSERADVLVAFAHRCDVDVTYPDRSYIGNPDEVYGRMLWLCPDSARLRKECALFRIEKIQTPPSEVPPKVAYMMPLDKHDAAMLYFNKAAAFGAIAAADVLGVEEPEVDLRSYLRSIRLPTQQSVVVLSEKCMDMMQRSMRRSNDNLNSIIGMAASALLTRWLRPLVGEGWRSGLVEMMIEDLIESERVNLTAAGAESEQLVRDPRIAFLGAPSISSGRFRLTDSDGNMFDFSAFGVVVPPSSEEQEIIMDFLRQVVGNSALGISPLGTDQGVGFVFAPDEQVIINYELLRHGLVRLDIHLDEELIREFPELIEAAEGAIEQGLGFASRWRQEKDYPARIAQLSRAFARPKP